MARIFCLVDGQELYQSLLGDGPINYTNEFGKVCEGFLKHDSQCSECHKILRQGTKVMYFSPYRGMANHRDHTDHLEIDVLENPKALHIF